MTAAILFTVAIVLILFRVFVLHLRETDLDNKTFVKLPKEVQLAILKERVLETPSERQLENLGIYLEKAGRPVNIETYRPLLAEQLRISRDANAIELDNALYAKESAWMDQIEPFEFAMARAKKSEGDTEAFVKLYLQGVLRYYSDEKIENALEALIPEHAPAEKMLADYRALKVLRDESGADDASIEKLSRAKELWAKSLVGG